MAAGKVFAAKAFLLARILTILCSVVVVAVVAQVSGGGFVPDVGYFCHYSGPTGDFSRCDAVLALGIILLLVNCGLLVVQLFVHMEYPWSRVMVAVEAISTCLWLAISIVQVTGHLDSVEYRTTSDRDRIVVGIVFSFLAIPLTVINGLMFYASSAYDGALLGDGTMVQRYVRRLSSVRCWLAVEGIALLSLTIVLLALVVIDYAVTSATSLNRIQYSNSTCFFQVASDAHHTCRVLEATTACSIVFALVIAGEILYRFCVHSSPSPCLLVELVRIMVSLVVCSMHMASFVLTADDWSSEESYNTSTVNGLSGRERFGSTSEIGFSFIAFVVWLVLSIVWIKRLHGKEESICQNSTSEEQDAEETSGTYWDGNFTCFTIGTLLTTLFSLIIFPLLYTVNYDGEVSHGNVNSSCAYAHNEVECQYVIAIPILSFVLGCITLLYLCIKCMEYRVDQSNIHVVIWVTQVLLFVFWISEVALLLKQVGTFGFGRPAVIAAIVFSFFTIITLCGTCAKPCITECCVNDSTSSGGDCDGSTTMETASIRLAMLKSISLILVIVCSLVILVSVAAYGEWYSEASSKGECIFGQSAVCSLLLSTSCLSLAIAIGLIIYLHLTGYKLPSVPITISTPMSILCFVVTIVAISSWNHGLPASSPTKQWGQGVRYNAGYSSCGTSLCLSLLWLVFVIVNACEFHGKHKGTFCTVELGGAGDYSRQWTGGEDPLCGFSGEDGCLNGCSVRTDCYMYIVNELGLDGFDSLWDSNFDRCYCRECHTVDSTLKWTRGQEQYIPPEGWCRFGLKPEALVAKYGGDEVRAKAALHCDGTRRSEEWPVAYHGTASKNIRSIFEEGRLLAPGQRTKSGKVIEVVDDHIGTHNKSEGKNADGTPFNWKRVFLSPSMNYSGDYCKQPKILLSKTHMVALQTRVNPKAITRSPDTLPNMAFDDRFPRDELEWVVDDGRDAIIYGLLIRRLEQRD